MHSLHVLLGDKTKDIYKGAHVHVETLKFDYRICLSSLQSQTRVNADQSDMRLCIKIICQLKLFLVRVLMKLK